MPNTYTQEGAVHSKGAAWVNVGWYKTDQDTGIYKRIGDCWVTLDVFESGQLILHDPAQRAGHEFSNEFVSVLPIKSGKLVGNKKGLPVSAKGFYRLGSGMHKPKKADLAIIDGIVILQI